MENFMRIILSLFLLMCSFASQASDVRASICVPCISEEFSQLLAEQNKAKDTSLAYEMGEGAFVGFAAPWMASFALGSFLSMKIQETGDGDCSIDEFVGGGLCACVCLSPLELLAALPLSFASMSFSAIKWLVLQIMAAKNESECSYQMNAHLYWWMDVIKRGRLAIREEIIAQQKMAIMVGETSLAMTALQLLRGDRFEQYFNTTSFDQATLYDLLTSIEQENDNWESFFSALSEKMRISELDKKQWQMLEDRLISFRAMAYDAPELSVQEIKENLPLAIYFISLSQQQLVKALTASLK
jgi:hypothetical protein